MSVDTKDKPRQTGIRVDPDVSRRLGVVARWLGVDKSTLADRAFRDLLRREERKLARELTDRGE